MNVLQIINYSAPYRGNFIDSLESLESNDIRKIKNYYLFHQETKEKSAEWIDSINPTGDSVFYLSGNLLKDIRLISNIVVQKSIEVIHMHFWGIRVHTIILVATFGKNVRLVRHFHNHSDYNEHFFKRMYGRIMYRSAIMVGCSESVADSIKRDFPNCEVRFVNNKISFERLNKYEKIAIGENPPHVVMMYGADFERKGVDVACNAIKNIHQKRNDVELLIVCSIAGKECEQKVCQLLQTEKVPNWIHIVPPRNDIATYYRISEFFISPSREEGSTYAIPEAVYCGCKVVASDIGGQSHYKDVPGIAWIEKDASQALESAIENGLEAPYDVNIARKYVVDKYGIQQWVKQIVDIYIN